MTKLFKVISLIIVLFQSANCATSSSTLIAGVGIGTFLIILSIAFSIIWCVACRSSARPQLYSILGLIVPLILILAFVLIPKESQRAVSTGVTDNNFVPHIVFLVISVGGFLLLGGCILMSHCFSYRKAKNIARSAFTVRNQERIEGNEEKEMGNSKVAHSRLALSSSNGTEMQMQP